MALSFLLHKRNNITTTTTKHTLLFKESLSTKTSFQKELLHHREPQLGVRKGGLDGTEGGGNWGAGPCREFSPCSGKGWVFKLLSSSHLLSKPSPPTLISSSPSSYIPLILPREAVTWDLNLIEGEQSENCLVCRWESCEVKNAPCFPHVQGDTFV